MKKKLLLLVIALVSALTCAIGFAACGEEKPSHSHNYSSWKSDESAHWLECLNDGCDEKIKDKDAHADKDNDGKCDICGYVLADLHTCEYNQTVAEEKYLYSAATCVQKAKYYYSCTCGKAGNATFEYGDFAAHVFTAYNYNNDATCVKNGTETAKCDNCTATDTREKANSATGIHKFVNYVSDNNATCTKNGTETAMCEYCTATDKREVENSKRHSFVDNVCEFCGQKGTDGLLYELNEDRNSYRVKGYGTATDTDLYIPSTYNGLPVTAIADGAFSGNAKITSVSIPASVTKIGGWAFSGCSKLKGLTIPDSVTTISDFAFMDCFIQTATLPSFACSYITTKTALKSVVITSGESIGNGALYDCSALTSITIPSSVKSIGDSAFNGCTSLTGITIPSSVTSMGEYAFCRCASLTSITIPASVTSIGDGVFSGCSSLTSITIPDSVTDMGSWAFENCPIETATIPADLCGHIRNSALKTVVITSGDCIGLDAFWECSSLTSVTIPETVTSIGGEAFGRCTSLVSITLPNSIQNIKYNAFCDCSSLKSINIPESVTNIEWSAFSGCSALTSITIPASVTSIDRGTFSGCSALTNITIPDSVTSIGDFAFENCNAIKTATVPTIAIPQIPKTNLEEITINSGESINAYAFSNSKTLKSVTISDSVTSIGELAFLNCDSINQIKFTGGIESWCGINGIENLTTAMSNVYVGDRKLSEMTSLVIPDGVTRISEYAFHDCRVLTSVSIPDSVTSIESWAFNGCSSLTSVSLHDGVESIGYNAFGNCTALTLYCEAAQKPSNWVEDWNWSHCPVVWNCKSNEIADNYCIYKVIDGIRYAILTLYGDRASVARQPENISGEVIISSKITHNEANFNVTSIVPRAFENCRSVTSVTLPDGITEINDYAFDGCQSMTEINIPESVRSIGNYAFAYCNSLASITIPSSVTNMGDEAFGKCFKLIINCQAANKPAQWSNEWNKLYLAEVCPVVWDCENNEVAADGSIYRVIAGIRYSLKDGEATIITQTEDISGDITIPEIITYKNVDYEVTAIGDNAFEYNSLLTSISLPAGVKSIGNYAFNGCSLLASINFPDNMTEIGEYAFSYCKSLTSLNLPDSITDIGKNAFFRCTSLKSINIPDGVTIINENMFYECSSLTDVTIGSGVERIGSYAFRDCSSLISIIIPEGVQAIGYYAFKGCGSLVNISIPDSVKSIDRQSFDGCDKLIQTENGVQYIDKWVVGCDTALTEFEFRSDTYGFAVKAFKDCYKITDFTVPDGIAVICSNTFEGCYALLKLTIPSSVTVIGGSIFTTSQNVIIYCEAASKPVAWDSEWNAFYYIDEQYYVLPVIWNYKNNEVADNGYIYKEIDGIRYSLKDGEATVIRQLDKFSGEIVIPSKVTYKSIDYSVTSIESFAFANCNSLTSVTLPDGLTDIGNSAFANCNLRSLIIPDSVKSIGEAAFAVNPIRDVKIGNGITFIGRDVFSKCYITTAEIPAIACNAVSSNILKTVTVTCGDSIPENAFGGCSALESVSLPDSVTSIGRWAFGGCSSLTSITVSENNENYKSIDGNLYSKDGTRLILYATGKTTSSFTIPDSVISISEYAFQGFSSLTSITISDGVTNIGSGAFCGCYALTDIIFIGTKEQWNAIEKDTYWNDNTGNYTVHCTDGDIAKE